MIAQSPESATAIGSASGDLAPEPVSRVCPRCSALSQVGGEFCPHCGQRFGVARSGVSSRVKLAIAGLALLLVLGGAGAAVAIKLHHDSQVAAQHRQVAAQQRQAAAAEQARAQAAAQARQTQQAAQAAEVTNRQSLETQLQTAITKDATHDVNQGLLVNGPAQSTTCTPVSGGSSQSLGESTGTYSCSAIYQTNSDGTTTGYRYSGTINFQTGMLSWQLGGNG
jgi:type II secretory pathway pseudopilin PulG